MEKENQNTIKLFNNLEIPRFGLGTYSINDSDVIYNSIKNGVRMIDTALFYENEKVVGEGISKALKDNLCKREELFIITKIWPTHYDRVEETIKQQLIDLQLDYVDLYLLHWPLRVIDEKKQIMKVPTHVLWEKLEGLVKNGQAKSIGLSNFQTQLILDILTYCEIQPAVNEIELLLIYKEKNW